MFGFLKKIFGIKFIRFSLVGFCGVITNLAVFFICRKYLKIDLNLSSVLAFCVAVTQNYFFNHFWSFKNEVLTRPNFKAYFKYVSINLFSLFINLLTINLVLKFLVGQFAEVFAQALGVIAGFVFTFLGSSIFVFKSLKVNSNFLKSDYFFALKNEYRLGTVIFLGVFGVIYLGQMFSVVGSKSILKPLNIEAVNVNGESLSSFQKALQLTRAGNYTLMTPPPNYEKNWEIKDVFAKKVLVGLSSKDLSELSEVSVKIGEKVFVFNRDEFLENWKPISREVLGGNLSGKEGDDYIFFEAPYSVRYSTSKIPVFKSFFSNVLNWAGDDEIILKPFKRSLFLGLLGICLLFAIRFFVLYLQKFFSSQTLKEDEIKQKQNYLIYSVLLYFGLFFLFGLCLLIYIFYQPDISLILNKAKMLYENYFFKSIRPKPVEKMQFLLSAVLILPFFLILYKTFLNKISLSQEIVLKWYKRAVLLNSFFVFTLVYLGLSIVGFFFVRDSIFNFTFGNLAYSLVFFPVLLFAFFSQKYLNFSSKILKSLIIFSLVIVFSLSVVNVFDGYIPLDLDPVIFPVIQVMSGESLLSPLTSFYGLYPLFLKPIFVIFGISVLKFSVVMGVLMLFSFWSLYSFFCKNIKNQIVRLSGFLFVIFYTVLATRVVPEYYFQYWPIRFIFPALGLWLISKYLILNNKKYYYLNFFVFALGILWNLEIGITPFLSWLLLLIFNDLTNFQSAYEFFKKILKHLYVAVCIVGIVGIIFSILTKFLSGNFPDFSLMFRYQKLFLSGYLNIGMIPPPHIWTFVALVYLAGFLFSTMALYNKQVEYIHKIIFLLCVLGLGLFAYYEGQSSDITLFRTAYPALIILVIFADSLWERIKKYGNVLYGDIIALICILFVIFSVPFSLLINSKTYYRFLLQAKQNITLQNSKIQKDGEFLRKFTKPKEKVFILASPYQGVLHLESQTYPLLKTPSVSDVVFPKDREVMLNFLKENKNIKIFIKKPLDFYNIFDSRIVDIVNTRYKETFSSENDLGIYEVK